MTSEFDASEFVDDDYHASRKPAAAGAAAASGAAVAGEGGRAPTREEVDAKVGEMQQKLAELKRVQQELEHERAGLEELRRKQIEFTTGRQEMIENLTRGVGLLSEAEFAARRDAEQMAKTLAALREALAKLESVNESTWAKENLTTELTRASTTVENARMEWNSARLKFPFLSGAPAEAAKPNEAPGQPPFIRPASYAELCKMGLALTWPLALVALAIFIALLMR